MLLDVVKSALAPEVAALKRMRTRAMLTGLALVVFVFAFFFGMLALFLGLSETMRDWVAALVVAAVGGAIGGIILLIARGKRRGRRIRHTATTPEPLVSDISQRRPDPHWSMSAVSAALAAGILLGRNLPK